MDFWINVGAMMAWGLCGIFLLVAWADWGS